jgi:hypothetical protein
MTAPGSLSIRVQTVPLLADPGTAYRLPYELVSLSS